ncbi:MAG: hypothetical protein IPJ77_24340 [Planctomycetes bacterium]|nr:hypothetical protein [Planctomycetota bacterium]
MANETDIQSLIANFTEQLTQVIRRKTLEQVLAALGGDQPAAPVRRGPGRPRGAASAAPARRAKGGKRSAAEMEQFTAELVAYVKANPGQRGEQIAAALKTDVKTMRLPMLKLIAAKAISTKGQRRGMTYFPAGGGSVAASKAEAPAKKKAKRGGKKKAG